MIIKNAQIINEGKIFQGDVLIKNDRIEKIASEISCQNSKEIDAKGAFLMPGVIDDQVHFREPGLTHKADISSESRAAVAGGVTSFFEQPNTNPQTITLQLLEEKFAIAQKNSHANYSFFLGGTNNNLEELKRFDPRKAVGIKLFLGSSTGNMLVDNQEVLENIFLNVNSLIATHCEDEATIKNNLAYYSSVYGEKIPMAFHPKIRSEEACFISSQKAVELAKKTSARLHIFHISTEKELSLFDNQTPLNQKKITAEVCVHHLWFSDEDYAEKGAWIKWNPAVKTLQDRDALWQGLLSDRLDVVATDHAPHTFEEKTQKSYLKIPSGGPLVQHSLVAMLEKHSQGFISKEKIVEKMCHNPAILFKVKERGFIREGYFADLVLVENLPLTVSKDNILYKCGWSPFLGQTFGYKVSKTFVNGQIVYENGRVLEHKNAKRVEFL